MNFVITWEGERIPLAQVTKEMLDIASRTWPEDEYRRLYLQAQKAKCEERQASVQTSPEKCQDAGIPQSAAGLSAGGDPWDHWKSERTIA